MAEINIAKLMKEKGISIKQLANDMGVSERQVELWRSGTIPSWGMVNKLVQYFNAAHEKVPAKDKKDLSAFEKQVENTATVENLGNISVEDIAMLNALNTEDRNAVRMLMQRLLNK